MEFAAASPSPIVAARPGIHAWASSGVEPAAGHCTSNANQPAAAFSNSIVEGNNSFTLVRWVCPGAVLQAHICMLEQRAPEEFPTVVEVVVHTGMSSPQQGSREAAGQLSWVTVLAKEKDDADDCIQACMHGPVFFI
jgi:hypothetical protein